MSSDNDDARNGKKNVIAAIRLILPSINTTYEHLVVWVHVDARKSFYFMAQDNKDMVGH